MIPTDIEKTLAGKYPAKAHAEKVAAFLREAHPEITEGLVYIESQKSILHKDSDQEVEFRQYRPFFYLTGCPLADSYVTYNLASKELTLYIPPIDADSVIWCGLPPTPADALSTYDVDAVRLTTPDLARDLSAASGTVFTYAPEVYPLTHSLSPTASHNTSALKDAVCMARVTKTPYELALMRKANSITTTAFAAAASRISSAKNERELYAAFTERCISGGAPTQAYGGIFAAGTAAATLHYIPNNAPLAGKLNVLIDAGAEVDCYASDVTRVFPLNGKFTKESEQIYSTVLDMQKAVLAELKAGVNWDDMHVLAHRVAIAGLLKIGILRGGSVDEILAARTSTAFLPHGLGHYLGMDTHDPAVGAVARDSASQDPLWRYLRKRGPLEEGCVITVEPGLYFCEFIIRPYLADEKHARFIDESVLDRYWSVGGVRIEDDVVITREGCENLTDVPKEVAEVEAAVGA
ncbi:putative Xaa-Pro aminopeptidase [Geopyxis carbonaria]|nr:putative Xaa-Pro aminopeptidase [Geopyxis carbonaria]